MKQRILLVLLLPMALHAVESPWDGAQWIACDRPLTTPELAPAEWMGDWIAGPAGTAVRGYRTTLELPDTPVVRAMAWWGTQPSGPASVVVNDDDGYFDRLVPRPKRALDLAFQLRPGGNTVELRFREPVRSRPAAFGLRIQFADGTERTLRSSPEWKALRPDGESLPVASRGSYGQAGIPPAVTYRHQRLAPAWFRTTVQVGPGLRSATLRHCALGYGDPFLNGRPVSGRVLSPPFTDYEALAMFETDEVTGLLRQGENALAFLVAPGWFHQVGGFATTFSYGRPRVLAALELKYEDGRSEQVVSGPSWQWKEGEIVESNIYNGDVIDYRRAHHEWAEPGAGEGWSNASLSEAPCDTLIPVDFPAMRRIREIAPAAVSQVGSKTWLVDFGENITGWIKLGINEPTGAEVLVRYSEMARDGRLWNVPESHWWCHGQPQRDVIVSGGSPVSHEGRFSYKGFRWVEISGLSMAPDPETLRAVVVHNDCPVVAGFSSSDPLLNRLWDMGVRTHLSNMHSILEDCPHREKCQWGGDLHGSWAMGFHALDSAEFYRQQVRLYYTGPMAKGGIPGLVGVGKRLSTVQMDFNWGVSPLFLAWRLWTQFGDLDTAREFHPQMRHYLEYFNKADPDGFPSLHRHADHAAPDAEILRAPQDKELISAINFFAAAERFAQLSDALGRPADAEWARELAVKIRAAVLTRYDADAHTFGNGTHDSLALAMGIFRGDPRAEQQLASAMAGHYRRNGHKFDGGFMTYWLYPMLSRHGYANDALKMLRNTGYPGPAWSVERWDATTFWERFYTNQADQFERSLSHHATNHPAAWLLTDLAGIRLDLDRPGGGHLLLAPHFPDGLDRAAGSMTIRGKGQVTSAWKRDGGEIEWTVQVPEGVEARTVLVGHTPATAIPGTLAPGRHQWRIRQGTARP